MMRMLIKTLLITSVFICCLCSCTEVANSSDSNSEVANSSDSTKSISYNLIEKCYQKDNIIIYYPQIEGYENKEKEKEINDLFKKASERGLEFYKLEESEKKDLDLDVNYIVKYKSEKFISVVFQGMGDKKGTAYPNHLFYTVNIDLDSAKRLTLLDLCEINANFANVLLDKGKANAEQPDGALDYIKTAYEVDDIVRMLSYSDLVDPKYYWTTSYFTDDSIGISFEVIHAMGDHAECEISYSEIDEFIKININKLS